MEIFKPNDYGLSGLNTTNISECFQAGLVLQQDSLSNILKKNNYPPPEPDWKLNENQYLVLSNRLKQLTGHGKTKNGLPINFPNTAPLINTSPPRYSFKDLVVVVVFIDIVQLKAIT